MNIVTEINAWREIRKELGSRTIGLVHTMGNLHDGHLSLVHHSKQENDATVVAIYINPMQFNQARDFELYPRTLDEDKSLLAQNEVDYLLILSTDDLYPDHYQIQIHETEISKELEGEYRPGHFNGMLTIVLKFLNIVQPTRSYYGEKDYQQLLLIKKMTHALFISSEIVSCATIRAEEGLALSSRNRRLDLAQREYANHLPRLLQSNLTPEKIVCELEKLGFKVDYVVDKWQRRLAAVWLGDVRLIDNVPL